MATDRRKSEKKAVPKYRFFMCDGYFFCTGSFASLYLENL